MNKKEQIEQYLKDHSDALKNNDLDTIYKDKFIYRFKDDSLVDFHNYELTSFLIQHNVNPLNYVSRIYAVMYSYMYMPKLVVPANIETIGSNAFEKSHIDEIYLSPTLKSVYANAFEGCKDTTIIFDGTEEQWKEYDPYGGIRKDVKEIRCLRE